MTVPAKLPLPRALAYGLGIFLAVAAVVVPLSFVNFYGALGAGLVVGLGLLVWLSSKHGSSMLVAAVLAVASVDAGAVFLQDYLTLRGGNIVTLARVDEARMHPRANGFLFSDAAFVGRIRGVHREQATGDGSEGGAEVRAYVVSPLVDRDWEFGNEVPVWIGCVGGQPNCGRPHILEGSFTAIRVPEADMPRYRQAIAQLRNRFPVGEMEGAPVLQLVPSIERAQAFTLTSAWALPLGAFLVWALGLAGWRWWRGRKSGGDSPVS